MAKKNLSKKPSPRKTPRTNHTPSHKLEAEPAISTLPGVWTEIAPFLISPTPLDCEDVNHNAFLRAKAIAEILMTSVYEEKTNPPQFSERTLYRAVEAIELELDLMRHAAATLARFSQEQAAQAKASADVSTQRPRKEAN